LQKISRGQIDQVNLLLRQTGRQLVEGLRLLGVVLLDLASGRPDHGLSRKKPRPKIPYNRAIREFNVPELWRLSMAAVHTL
jgi:hypothetical protein